MVWHVECVGQDSSQERGVIYIPPLIVNNTLHIVPVMTISFIQGSVFSLPVAATIFLFIFSLSLFLSSRQRSTSTV